MIEMLHEAGHGSCMQRVGHPSCLEGEQVVAQGLPIAQGGSLPLALGGAKGRVCLSGRLVAAAVDEVEVAHCQPGLYTPGSVMSQTVRQSDTVTDQARWGLSYSYIKRHGHACHYKAKTIIHE